MANTTKTSTNALSVTWRDSGDENRVQELLHSPDTNLWELSRELRHDRASVIRLMREANRLSEKRLFRVQNVHEAIVQLGLNRVRRLLT